MVEVMVALVSVVGELRLQKELIQICAQEVFEKTGIQLEYAVGSMIELPRAALLADQIAAESDFFSLVPTISLKRFLDSPEMMPESFWARIGKNKS